MAESDEPCTVADGPPSPIEGADLYDHGSLIGTDVGGYIIDGELGRGGMGIVFSATHPVIGKRAAIKVLKPSLSNNPATVERFVQEARSVNQIGHPNIVDIFAFGKLPDGRSYLVMDLLVGESLRKRVKRSALPIGEVLTVIDEIASALVAAHGKGFIHRDLKPDNVFLLEREGRSECRLLDFGLAKLMPNAMQIRAYRTATGAQLGTPDYMSPEQLKCSGIDERSDIFALGVLAFEILTGGRPRRGGDGAFELGGMTVSEAVCDRARAPAELADLVEAMLAYDPDRRPSLAAIRAVVKRVRGAIPTTSVVGLQVDIPAVRPILPTPPTGAPTVAEGPAARGSQSSLPQTGAGLRAPGTGGGSTFLGVAPPPARPSLPLVRPPSTVGPAPRRESKSWILVGILLVLACGAALLFVLAR